jgi:hypothetical protein
VEDSLSYYLWQRTVEMSKTAYFGEGIRTQAA